MSIQHDHARTRLSFGGTLNSEWIKLRTLRSTFWCYLVTIVLVVGFSALVAFAQTAAYGFEKNPVALPYRGQQMYWLNATTAGITFAELVVIVLGALVISGEYGTGMIRSTFAAVPRRFPALAAKTIVFAVVTLIVSGVSLVLAALVAAAILPGADVHPDFGDGHVWLGILGGALEITLVGILALALGAIIRVSAGAIAAGIGITFVLRIVALIVGGLTSSIHWIQNVIAFLPSNAGDRMYAYVDGPVAQRGDLITLAPWQGGLVLLAWFAVAYVIASILLARRDV